MRSLPRAITPPCMDLRPSARSLSSRRHVNRVRCLSHARCLCLRISIPLSPLIASERQVHLHRELRLMTFNLLPMYYCSWAFDPSLITHNVDHDMAIRREIGRAHV